MSLAQPRICISAQLGLGELELRVVPADEELSHEPRDAPDQGCDSKTVKLSKLVGGTMQRTHSVCASYAATFCARLNSPIATLHERGIGMLAIQFERAAVAFPGAVRNVGQRLIAHDRAGRCVHSTCPRGYASHKSYQVLPAGVSITTSTSLNASAASGGACEVQRSKADLAVSLLQGLQASHASPGVQDRSGYWLGEGNEAEGRRAGLQFDSRMTSRAIAPLNFGLGPSHQPRTHVQPSSEFITRLVGPCATLYP